MVGAGLLSLACHFKSIWCAGEALPSVLNLPSLSRARFRAREAVDAFLVAEFNGSVAGFVCGTLASGELTEESMGEHDPAGTTLCIHSVCVAAAERRKGLGSRMMKAYVAYVAQSLPHIKHYHLLCKEHLIEFYRSAGFSLIGESAVVLGTDPWFDMSLSAEGHEGAADEVLTKLRTAGLAHRSRPTYPLRFDSSLVPGCPLPRPPRRPRRRRWQLPPGRQLSRRPQPRRRRWQLPRLQCPQVPHHHVHLPC